MGDREPVKYITKSWVEENTKNITKRDLEILQIINENRIVTRDQLITLHPSFVGKRQPINIINRRIKILYESYCIDKVQPLVGIGEGSAQSHITLDRAGAILLGMDKFRPIIIEDPSSYPPKRLPMYYKHTVGIVDMKCSLIELIRENKGQLIRWSVEEDNKVEFKFKKRFILKPDVLAIVIRDKNKGSIFFYEHDQGTEYKKVIQDKIEGYIAYRLSNTWLNEEWVRMMKIPTFPPLIILTTGGQNRVSWIKDIAAKSGINIIVDHTDNRRFVLEKVVLG